MTDNNGHAAHVAEYSEQWWDALEEEWRQIDIARDVEHIRSIENPEPIPPLVFVFAGLMALTCGLFLLVPSPWLAGAFAVVAVAAFTWVGWLNVTAHRYRRDVEARSVTEATTRLLENGIVIMDKGSEA